jgi:serine phosphatase RsbU (regulator of sigma subunit)
VGNTGLACGEVRGGNQVVHAAIDLPGLEGTLYSSACDGPHGGDIHYLSVCGSGLLTRVCLADVAGHGDAVAAVGREMYGQLRRSVDTMDERRVLRAIDRRVSTTPLATITTAVMVTYYPPSRRLTVSYAGHPPAWFYTAASGTWSPIDPEPARSSSRGPVGLPLGTGLAPGFTRRRIPTSQGDRLLLLTDGVLEATSPDGEEFGQAGLARLLGEFEGPHAALVDHLRAGLVAHTGSSVLTHDDVSLFVAEVVDAPPGPALWHVLRNRLGSWAPRPAGDIRPLPTDGSLGEPVRPTPASSEES